MIKYSRREPQDDKQKHFDRLAVDVSEGGVYLPLSLLSSLPLDVINPDDSGVAVDPLDRMTQEIGMDRCHATANSYSRYFLPSSSEVERHGLSVYSVV